MMRRAVSPIVATVLLIIIAVAAGVLVWVWLHGFASKNPATTPAINERFEVEAVDITGGGGNYTITLYVRNVGGVPINVTTAYLIDYKGKIVGYNSSVNVAIKPGEVKKIIDVFENVTLTPGYQYTIKLVTADGVETTHTFVPPP